MMYAIKWYVLTHRVSLVFLRRVGVFLIIFLSGAVSGQAQGTIEIPPYATEPVESAEPSETETAAPPEASENATERVQQLLDLYAPQPPETPIDFDTPTPSDGREEARSYSRAPDLGGAFLPRSEAPHLRSGRYQIYSDYPDVETVALALRLETLFNFFNRYFNFNPTTLTDKLTVRYFSSKDRFDSYVREVAGRSYEHFVYIDYNHPERNELVIYPTERNFDRLVAHFAFLQFIEGFIESPPLWLREGFAIYFESSIYNSSTKYVQFQENSGWLDTLRTIILEEELLDWEQFLSHRSHDIHAADRHFYPQAWGLASFLVDHRVRATENLFQNVIASLERGASEDENIDNLLRAFRSAFSFQELEDLYSAYILSRPSFQVIIQEGINNYNLQKLQDAEQSFYRALAFNRESHVPYYYLGLVNYEKGEHQTAEHFYIESLVRSEENKGVIYYALGLNALERKEGDQARSYLLQARDHAPELRGLIEDMLLSVTAP